jgi:hypothetical protein
LRHREKNHSRCFSSFCVFHTARIIIGSKSSLRSAIGALRKSETTGFNRTRMTHCDIPVHSTSVMVRRLPACSARRPSESVAPQGGQDETQQRRARTSGIKAPPSPPPFALGRGTELTTNPGWRGGRGRSSAERVHPALKAPPSPPPFALGRGTELTTNAGWRGGRGRN